VAQKTLDEYHEDVAALFEVAGIYAGMPPGPARNAMHMIYFGLGKLKAELEKGAVNRGKAVRHRAKVSGRPGVAHREGVEDVPLF